MTYDIVVGVGQSNVAGAATDYVSGDQYPAGIYMWNHATSTIVPAAEPQSNADTITGMGVTNTFLKDYAANYLPSGRDLLIVNVSRGGTGFTTPSTNSAGTGLHWRYDLADDSNNLARRGLEKIQAAVTAAGPGARIVAFLANHGSTDGTNNTGKTLMKTYLTAWINWIRSELDVPTVPYIAMQMRRNLIDTEPRHKAIDDATKEVAAELENVVHVPSPLGDAYYKSTDVVHFNALGVRTIGHAMFDAWLPLSDQFGGTWSDIWTDTWGAASTLARTAEFTLSIGSSATWAPALTRTATFTLAIDASTVTKPGRTGTAGLTVSATAVGVVRLARTATATLTLGGSATAGTAIVRNANAPLTIALSATHTVRLTRTATADLTLTGDAAAVPTLTRAGDFTLTVTSAADTTQRQELTALAALTLDLHAVAVIASDHEERDAAATLTLTISAATVIRITRTAPATLTLGGHATAALRIDSPIYLGDLPVSIRVGDTPVVLA